MDRRTLLKSLGTALLPVPCLPSGGLPAVCEQCSATATHFYSQLQENLPVWKDGKFWQVYRAVNCGSACDLHYERRQPIPLLYNPLDQDHAAFLSEMSRVPDLTLDGAKWLWDWAKMDRHGGPRLRCDNVGELAFCVRLMQEGWGKWSGYSQDESGTGPFGNVLAVGREGWSVMEES